MPADFSACTEILQLKAEIVTAMREPGEDRDRFDRFFWWKIRNENTSDKPEYTFSSGDGENYSRKIEDGYYLTNLVLQGGGALGLAHAGFIVGLECARVRTAAVAGTSAGAIVALALVILRGRDITHSVGDHLSKLVQEIPMDTFIDGPRPIRKTIKRFLNGGSFVVPTAWSGLLESYNRLKRRRGLNSGLAFENWMRQLLVEQNINSFDDLTQMLDSISCDLRKNEHSPFSQGKGICGGDILRIISTAMPTGTKFSLPKDMRLLSDEYQHQSPALMVRMSMSIPLFFEPVKARTNAVRWPEEVAANLKPFISDAEVEDMKNLRQLTFLDGGLFSNLPTDELTQSMPLIPTISVPLVSTDRVVDITSQNTLKSVINDAAAIVNTVRLQRDRDAFVMQNDRRRRWKEQGNGNRIFPQATAKINTGRANWLNFSMNADEKEELFLAGLKRARDVVVNGRFDDV